MTEEEIAKVLCCPTGECLHPEGCYLPDKSRMVAVNLWECARALKAKGEQFAPPLIEPTFY